MIPRLLNRLFHPRPITLSEWLAGMRELDQTHPLPAPRFRRGMRKGKLGVSTVEKRGTKVAQMRKRGS